MFRLVSARGTWGSLYSRCPERPKVPGDVGGSGNLEVPTSYVISDIVKFARAFSSSKIVKNIPFRIFL